MADESSAGLRQSRRERRRRLCGAQAGRRLFLIDGPSLVYRAFFALPESIATSTGVPTNAIFGFASMLVKIVTEYGVCPTVVAWDAGTSGRSEMFPEYKAQRALAPGPAEGSSGRRWHRWSRRSATATCRSRATRPTT